MSLVRWVWWCSGVGVIGGPTVLVLLFQGAGQVIVFSILVCVGLLGYAGSLLVERDDAPLAVMLGPFAACAAGWIAFLVSIVCAVAISGEL
jgi:hypothetical protein